MANVNIDSTQNAQPGLGARGPNPTVSAAPEEVAAAPPVALTEFERAFAEVEAEIAAIPTEHLVHITVDVRYVAVNTLARLPRLQGLREQITAELPRFELGALDRLGTYALAAAHAYFLNQMAVASPAEIAALAALAAERRAVLLADVKAFVAHGLLDGAPLAGLAGAVGYRNVAYDLLLLRNLLVEAWPRLADKTALSPAALEQDAATASRLLMAAGTKSVVPLEPSETARVRDQAFALFVKRYDQVRRAVAFVRWQEGDADDYAPSLYAGRASRKSDEPPELDAPPATGVTGSVMAPGSTTAPAAAAPTGTATPVAAAGGGPFVA